MDIAIVLYDRFTALDAIGPYEVLSRLPGAQRDASWPSEAGPGADRQRHAHDRWPSTALGELEHPDVVLVPGRPRRGRGARRRAACSSGCAAPTSTSTWTTSVCTGSLILAAAGLLEGKHATCHWLAIDALAALGAQPSERAGRLRRQDRDRRRGVGRDRHGARAGRADRRATPSPRRSSWASSTTRSRRSTRARRAKAPAEVVELLRGRSRFRPSSRRGELTRPGARPARHAATGSAGPAGPHAAGPQAAR